MTDGRITNDVRPGLWARIKRMGRTDVGALLRGLNAADLEALEQVLLEADFGVPATLDLVEWLEVEVRAGRLKTEPALREALQGKIAALLSTSGDPARVAHADPPGPTVILVAGVNGAGKTTTIAKLATRLGNEGRRVLLAAADTYRAGAIAQLEQWAERIGVPCVAGAPGGDPAAVAFDAIAAARARGADTVLVDTAGRLHTQDGLMDELTKVARVVSRQGSGAPHETFLVLDGTVGQNAVQQGRRFAEVLAPTGLIVTKLDGTARGGALVALRRELAVPIRFIGTGEGVLDLQPFDPAAFAERIVGRDPGPSVVAS
ncbi:MAG: signal recognition particle-docking protein FtsY [Gemmatimonadales bacterium]